MSAVSMVGNSLVALMSTLTTGPFSKLFGSLLFSDLLELPAFFWHILSPISWDPQWWQHRTPQGTIYVLLKFRIGCNLSFSVGLWCHGFTRKKSIFLLIPGGFYFTFLFSNWHLRSFQSIGSKKPPLTVKNKLFLLSQKNCNGFGIDLGFVNGWNKKNFSMGFEEILKRNTIQGRRKVWKTKGLVVMSGDNVPPPRLR